MTTSMEETQPHTTEDLEAELEEIRHELQAKRSRDGSVQLAAFFAVLLALGAILAVAFKLDDNQSSGTPVHNRASGNMPAAMGAGAGGASRSSAGAAHQVSAQLGDYTVHPNVTSVPAGKVTFNATNVGQVPHELMIERMPIKMDAPGQPNEKAAQGMIDDMGPGQSGHMTLNLKPGSYMLFCNVPGHYQMGQHTMFKVTG
jgi:uncharacterized cupredoxin-like copper-binding protein